MGHQCYKGEKNKSTIMHGLGLDSRTQCNYKSTRGHSKKSLCGMWMVLRDKACVGTERRRQEWRCWGMSSSGLQWQDTDPGWKRSLPSSDSPPTLSSVDRIRPAGTLPLTPLKAHWQRPLWFRALVLKLDPVRSLIQQHEWERLASGKFELRANTEIRQFVILI